MKNANAEPKKQVMEPRLESLVNEPATKMSGGKRPDFDLPQLQHMLTTIRERRADAEASLREAEEELSSLDEREETARTVLSKSASPEVKANIVNQAKSTLESINELRPWVKRRAERAKNFLGDVIRREAEFPRDLYKLLLEEERTIRAMNSR